MFAVINKNNNEVVNVYNISYDKKRLSAFLIYKDGQWVRMSAKYFVPVDWTNPIGDVALRG